MSIQAVAWAWEQAVPGNAKLVLLALANHADHVSGRCRFEPEAVARQASIKPTSLWRYLGALERNGFLVRETAKGPDGEERDFWLKFDRAIAAWDWGAERADGDDAAVPASAPPGVSGPPRGFRPDTQASERSAARTQAESSTGPVFVVEESRAWNAWRDYRRAQGKPMPSPYWSMGGNGRRAPGYHFPTLFPPGTALSVECAQ